VRRRAAVLRRARLLVSVAAVAAVATAVLLALLVAAVLSGRGAGVAASYGLAAYGAAVLALGLLVLARAGAVERTDPVRARALCARCTAGAIFAVFAVLVAGGVAIVSTRSGEPAWGAVVGGVLVAPLVGLAVWQRASVRAPAPPVARRPRSGGGGESEPGGGAGAR